MIKIFVSGCYDILHAGHIQFFEDAKALGDHLTVCFASDNVLWIHKKRKSSIPQEHKKIIIQSLKMVDDVVIGENVEEGLDFKDHLIRIKPDILAVTDDDQYSKIKRDLCAQIGVKYRVLPKTPPQFEPISTSEIVKWIRAPYEAPLRVDFAGGWIDVPRLSKKGGFIVNCAISPLVTLKKWDYAPQSGMGGSGAWALLNGENSIASELNLGVGWQDPAVIQETGLCVWESGLRPELFLKREGRMLKGLMAILYTGKEHDTPGLVNKDRNYDLIYKASQIAANAVLHEDIEELAAAVRLSYKAQIEEGMKSLIKVNECLACKYCGGGWGGYALYIFPFKKNRDKFVHSHSQAKAVEPYISNH